MKKKRSTGKRPKKIDADLDKEVDSYEPSDSDDDFTTEDKIMLERSKHGKYLQDNDSEEEVLRVHSSSEDEEDEVEEDSEDEPQGRALGSDYDSDLDDGQPGPSRKGDGLPNDKAWGRKKSKYYSTDYVDQDYGGFGKDEEELALMEEKEADAIQRRLLSQLEETDFTLGILDEVEQKKAELAEKSTSEFVREKITTDYSQLTEEEKLQILNRDSPELFAIIEDYKNRVSFMHNKLNPILDLVAAGEVPKCGASEHVRTQRNIIMLYSLNISYYLYAKAKGVRLDGHPVIRRLYQFRKLLREVDVINEEFMLKEIDGVLEAKRAGGTLVLAEEQEEAEPEPKNRAERRKKKLKILEEKREMDRLVEETKKKFEIQDEDEGRSLVIKSGGKNKRRKVTFDVTDAGGESSGQDDGSGDSDAGYSGEEETHPEEATKKKGKGKDDSEKRVINFTIAKNKGLTPKRKKEQRNPRVKHRNKYKKAKVRRKGQVREVRKELNRYSGEVSGIKAYVSKSIKFR
ncbi:hypothetical protein AAG570_005001 [Ranatra chinensis]|uniref:Sas10 C-terminal domain-containing protein n=1 Tax=Ranatra chinensis TaxID=642074 RepID=A0ABD0XZ61_9HEMI